MIFFGIWKSEVHIITSERTAFISPYTPPPPAIVNLRLVIIVIYTLDLQELWRSRAHWTLLFSLVM